jgi:hypothetical protein
LWFWACGGEGRDGGGSVFIGWECGSVPGDDRGDESHDDRCAQGGGEQTSSLRQAVHDFEEMSAWHLGVGSESYVVRGKSRSAGASRLNGKSPTDKRLTNQVYFH